MDPGQARTANAPTAGASSSNEFPAWGIFYAGAEVRPERTDLFFRTARETVAELAAKPAAADEFARAINPVLTGLERRQRTNAYWLGAMQARFADLPKTSIDYAIMEKARRVLVVEAAFDWDDVGNWPAVAKYLRQAGLSLTAAELFERPTVAALAAALSSGPTAREETQEPAPQPDTPRVTGVSLSVAT